MEHRNNDFGLWKVKMKAVLIQQMCEDALKGKILMSENLTQVEKTEMINKTRNTNIKS